MNARTAAAIANFSSPSHSPRMLFRRLPLLFAFFAAGSAAASTSNWMENAGGAVRLVTSGLADESGRLRGALEIRLEPGWKTYWRDPGDAGIPPQLTFSELSDITGAELRYPPPERVKDEFSTWAGYTKSIALPVIFDATPGSSGIVEGEVLLGICKTICIPFQASFSFDAGVDYENVEHAITVERAFAALPRTARDGFQVTDASWLEDRILIQAEVPADDAQTALFLVSPEGVRLAAPTLEEVNGSEATFSAEIISASDFSRGIELDYTLTSGGSAVNGTVSISK
ncbi:protein-disulfide reductase DsbD domain-containing protein [Chelativorans sp. YIM 93263]|uniref:protein-disulfide reductase DsbD domain-containing protein n=1 Tax=Chelativorans sp. YIM 93263 TaxID=2906648 RepID=UPI0023798026|nr:protein-disulfide reductase DsbD domain-containing protein [Chelativorans sp. YIM 93263]